MIWIDNDTDYYIFKIITIYYYYFRLIYINLFSWFLDFYSILNHYIIDLYLALLYLFIRIDKRYNKIKIKKYIKENFWVYIKNMLKWYKLIIKI